MLIIYLVKDGFFNWAHTYMACYQHNFLYLAPG